MTATLHDRYEILRPVARGGMAVVLLAREVDTGREVALKQLALPDDANPAEWRLRFQQEFHTTARLRHPHIVATYDYAVARDGVPFFTMEYLPGPGLEEVIPLAPERLMAWLPGLLQALGYLHHQGLVHGDLKPDNLRLAADGTVRLMDLGLVTRAGQTTAGLQGTLPYLPPEVIRRAPSDRRSDLYGLGAVLYHLLAGRAPFEGDPRQVLMGHLEREPEPIAARCAGLPPRLAEFVMRLLVKDPMQRFQSASEALQFLGASDSGDAVDNDQTLFHPPLLGRKRELRELENSLARTRLGAYEEVWVSGDADVGLEPLLEEFCCRAQIHGATVLRGAFRARMAPFEGLRGVVRGLMAFAKGASAEARGMVARVLPELGAPTPEAEGADPQQERLRLFEALTAMVRSATATGPLVLAFSNGQAGDLAWREWLDYLRRNAPDAPVLVVTTFVGDPELDLDPVRSELPLAPWSRDESHEACRAILGQMELDGPFGEKIHQWSGGYPQRVETTLRQLVDAGHLRRQSGIWVLPDGGLEAIMAAIDPTGTQERLFRALPPLALALLDALTLLGREIELYLLWQIVRAPRGSGRLPADPQAREDGTELFDALRCLEEGGWAQTSQGAVSLAPDRNRDDLLAKLDGTRRRQLHGAIAGVLETALAGSPGDWALVGELARHALAAGDRRRGPRYALEAAQQQARLFGLEAAEALLAESLALLGSDPAPDGATVLGHHRLRAEVARLAGDRRLAESSYTLALELAQAAGDLESQVALANGLGRLKLAAGELDEAASLFHSVTVRLGPQSVHHEVATALTLLGRCALTQGDLVAAARWVEQALAMARAGSYRPLVRENMAQLGYLYVAASDERATEGLGLLFEALQLTERDEAKLELNACYTLLGNAQLLLGRFTEAKLAFQRNCDLCAEIGAAPHDEALAFMRRATVELELGDYRAARKTASPAGALARMIGNRVLLAQVRLIEGMAALYQGEFLIYQDAAAWVEEALAATNSDYLTAMWHTCRAEALGFLGQWSGALSTAGQALEAAARGGGHEFESRATLVKGEALSRLGLFKPSRQTLEAMTPPRNEALQARWLLARAQLERQQGDRPAARRLGERALDLARRAGVVPVGAACAILLARVAENRDEALAWSRRALLDAEVCGQPALEAEALYQAFSCAQQNAQAEWFWAAAEDAWRRATAGLTPNLLDGFGSSEERKPLREAIDRRAREGYRPTIEDREAVLAILAAPIEPESLLSALAAFCRGSQPVGRVAVVWEDAHGTPTLAYGQGEPFSGASNPLLELEAARDATDGVLLWPLEAGVGAPWGAILVDRLSPEERERLLKLLSWFAGALWSAHQLALLRAPTPALPEPANVFEG